MVKSYRELIVWRKGIESVKTVYITVQRFPREEVYGLADQLKRASVSIPSNIAEGQARQSTKEFRQFLFIALGSLAEVDTQLVIAHELGFIGISELNKLVDDHVVGLRKMINGLLNKLTTDH